MNWHQGREPTNERNRETVAGITYLVNPTAQEVLGMLRRAEHSTQGDSSDWRRAVRGLVANDGTAYWWDAHQATHQEFAERALKMENYFDLNDDTTIRAVTTVDKDAVVKVYDSPGAAGVSQSQGSD